MFTLIIFYVLSSQFHTDVSSVVIPSLHSEKVCIEAANKISDQLSKLEVSKKITWSCIKSQE